MMNQVQIQPVWDVVASLRATSEGKIFAGTADSMSTTFGH